MKSRFFAYLLCALLILNLFALFSQIPPVQAAASITIKPDGSIQPATPAIQRTGSLYTLTENITFHNPGFDQAIRIECSNMTLDGNGFALNNATETCLYVIYATNVTIKNAIVTEAGVCGIEFYQSYNCTVIDNTLVDCNLHYSTGAIHAVQSKYFNISRNVVTGEGATERTDVWASPLDAGIYLVGVGQSDYHTVVNNRILSVPYGINLYNSHDNVVANNTIRNSTTVGIDVSGAQDTLFLNNSLSDCLTGFSVGGESMSSTISGNVVENSRDKGITVGGASYYTTITGNNVTNTWGNPEWGEGVGIQVSSQSTIVSKNRAVNNTAYGMSIDGDGNQVTDNYATDNGEIGILISGSPNAEFSGGVVSRNYAANNRGDGIHVSYNYSEISANIAINNSDIGIALTYVFHSQILDNTIANNSRGLYLYQFGNNSIYHNHLTNNTQQVYLGTVPDVFANSWDDGYPSGGNYWSNYTGADLYKGPNQDVLGSDGIGDTPYLIYTANVDRYPRVSEPSLGALTLSPNYGGNTGNVTVRVTGLSFSQDTAARLIRTGFSNITGAQTNVINSTQLTTTFNLAGADPDTTWDLVVVYANGTERHLEYAFHVMLGGEPIIYADITGRHQLRIAKSSVYTVRIYNKGNIDAPDQLLTLSTDPALKILSVNDPDGSTIWNRTALEQEIAVGQLIHPELWPGDSSQAVADFLNTTILYAPRISAGDCLTLQVEVYAKTPWNGDDPLVLLLAKIAMEKTLAHILSQIIAGELIFHGLDKMIVDELRTACLPAKSEVTATKVLVEVLLEEFGESVGSAASAFGKFGVGALTGISLTSEVAKKLLLHSDPETSVDKPIQPVSSYDPNDKAGPTGVGPEAYVPADTNFTYTVYFENLANATASAEDIVITDPLDPDLDWPTLSIGGSSHPDTLTASFNATSGTITWIFTGINLPPNVNPPEGEGWVSYSVSPKTGLATDTEIRNKATIVFDVNPPIDTPETLHTIDFSPPESAIQSLPAQSNSSFTLNWSGTDSGSGVKAYTVYYTDNDGPWVVWRLQTRETSATFDGQVGHTYKFYTRAIDEVGNWEESPQDPDATTTVDFDTTPPETQLSVGSPRYVDLEQTEYVTSATPLSLTATDNEGGFSGVASTHYHLFNTTYDSGWQAYLSAFYFDEVADGNYSLAYRSTDKNGNTETAKEKPFVLDNKAPEASVAIDYGASYTNSTEITLQLAATDVLQNTIEVRFSNDNVTYTEWEAYAPAKNWTLGSGYGPKTIYVQFKDFLGQVSTYSSTIEVIPEFPSLLILPLLMLASLIVVILCKRRRPESHVRRAQVACLFCDFQVAYARGKRSQRFAFLVGLFGFFFTDAMCSCTLCSNISGAGNPKDAT